MPEQAIVYRYVVHQTQVHFDAVPLGREMIHLSLGLSPETREKLPSLPRALPGQETKKCTGFLFLKVVRFHFMFSKLYVFPGQFFFLLKVVRFHFISLHAHQLVNELL